MTETLQVKITRIWMAWYCYKVDGDIEDQLDKAVQELREEVGELYRKQMVTKSDILALIGESKK